MAAAILVGNLLLPIDINNNTQKNLISDRSCNKSKHHSEIAPINRSKKDNQHRPLIRGSNSSSTSRIGASSSSSSPNNDNDSDDEDGDEDWEKKLRRKMKDKEEMRELEKMAAEIHSRLEEETEDEKRERVKRELEKVAKEQAERRATAKLMFEVGQKAYEKGTYSRAIEFLEAALTIVPGPTLFGGEIQIWLAMAYEANNRHRDCIELYYQLEKKHPSIGIRRQAAELRYILQAPKLKISKDEMVTIPLIGSSYDSYAGSWSDKYKDKDQRRRTVTTNQLPSSKDYLGDFLVFRPPSGWEENRYVWLFLAIWIGVVATVVIHR